MKDEQVKTEKQVKAEEKRLAKEAKAQEKRREKEMKGKEKVLDGYTSYYLVPERLTEEEAVEVLLAKLGDYREVSKDFLKKWKEKDGLTVTKEYLPVYWLRVKAEYLWKKKSTENVVVEHREERVLENFYAESNEELKAKEFAVPTAEFKETEKTAVLESLYPTEIVGVKQCMEMLRTQAKEYDPAKSKINLSGEDLDVLFVPVVKIVGNFAGVDYTGYVNLHNGGATAEYLPSEKLSNTVERFSQRALRVRASSAWATVYALTFAVMELIKWLFGSATNVQTLRMITIVSFACAFFTFLIFITTCGYKKQKVLEKALATGELPKPSMLVVLQWISAILALAVGIAFAVIIMVY